MHRILHLNTRQAYVMANMNSTMDLSGHFLISMPGMSDPRFSQTVIFMCAHSDEAAMGLIVNKPAHDIRLGSILEQLSIDTTDDAAGQTVYIGGPVETGRGFVLHSPDYRSPLETLDCIPDVSMTATVDILESIGLGKGPDKRLMMLGYSGWGPGQLEDEIARNGWLTAPADPKIVFDLPDQDKWQAAVSSLGINPIGLSGAAGRA